jgi:hypothetical protein
MLIVCNIFLLKKCPSPFNKNFVKLKVKIDRVNGIAIKNKLKAVLLCSSGILNNKVAENAKEIKIIETTAIE